MSCRTFARRPVVRYMPDGPDHRRRVYQDITQLIANPDNPTPMVKLGRINSNPSFEIYCKLEWFNPFGSLKDRTAEYLIDGLMERDMLNGQRFVEPTSGNTGIALTAIRLARDEGLLVGPSTGAVVSAALAFAEKEKGLAVVIVPDNAFKYVSFYKPHLKDQGRPEI